MQTSSSHSTVAKCDTEIVVLSKFGARKVGVAELDSIHRLVDFWGILDRNNVLQFKYTMNELHLKNSYMGAAWDQRPLPGRIPADAFLPCSVVISHQLRTVSRSCTDVCGNSAQLSSAGLPHVASSGVSYCQQTLLLFVSLSVCLIWSSRLLQSLVRRFLTKLARQCAIAMLGTSSPLAFPQRVCGLQGVGYRQALGGCWGRQRG